MLAMLLLASGSLLVGLNSAAYAQKHVIHLRPAATSYTNSETSTQIQVHNKPAMIYANVTDPELEVHLPRRGRANGASLILLPGGALRVLLVGPDEGEAIKHYVDLGVAVFVLKYRTIQANGLSERPISQRLSVDNPTSTSGGRAAIRNGNANPAPDDVRVSTALSLAIEDSQRALEIIRANAGRWGLDTQKVGMIGMSAGGGVALGTVIANKPGATPDYIVSLFGPSLMDVHVPIDAPPLFVAASSNHGPVTDGLLSLFSLWKGAGRDAEIHLFELPTGSEVTPSLWSPLLDGWLRHISVHPLPPVGQPTASR